MLLRHSNEARVTSDDEDDARRDGSFGFRMDTTGNDCYMEFSMKGATISLQPAAAFSRHVL